MLVTISARLAKELSLPEASMSKTVALLDEGATIPFLARYRKEVTGGLDEVVLTTLRDALVRLRALDKRRDAILLTMQERELLTPELEKAFVNASTLSALEDIYLPFRPKKVTRATKAKERGLEPLALRILEQKDIDISALAGQYVRDTNDAATSVVDIEAALAGARDIIAETIAEDMATRTNLRMLFVRKGMCTSKAVTKKDATAKDKEENKEVYKDYFAWEEPGSAMPSHRLLAVLRGEREGFLQLSFRPDDEEAIAIVQRHFVTSSNQASLQVRAASKDAWQRLLAPSLENEYRTALKERAEAQAVTTFATNLRKLLLASPLGAKRVLALDPGWRTGAKLVCLDEHGALLHHDVVYPLTGDVQKASAIIRDLCKTYAIEAIAVGNGTAGRETESFVKGLGLPSSVVIILVDERGASVYSASDVARKEFPNHDVTVRGAVSIGRRLMDPLAELVKVNPASLGVGQYQHDVNQAHLQAALGEVVASCVNAVGVDMNTASAELLAHVSGIGPALANNIIAYRQEHGAFATRKELLQVPRLGAKAFELSAGFLRIPNGKEPLDASAVHPERYGLVRQMAKDVGCTVTDLLHNEEARGRIKVEAYIQEAIGLPTLNDIMAELAKPGRDPRSPFEQVSFAEGITAIEHLQEGMELNGIVTNVTQFGAFVDIGVHRDGLVHISQLANVFVKNPHDVVSTGQKVRVRVMGVEVQRGRIHLSMKEAGNASTAH